jgi:mono/diheme cytochrome c family protein
MAKGRIQLRLAAIVTGVFAIVMAGSAGSAFAQDGDPEIGADAWRSGVCKQCHGWAGDGVPENNQSAGPSLRLSLLTPEQMVEAIRCGRPGTDMPSFRRNAWTEIIPCYSMTAPLEGAMAPVIESPLGDRTINGLVAFIFRDFVDQGPVTREYCWEIVGRDSTRCDAYPTEEEVAAEAAAAAP